MNENVSLRLPGLDALDPLGYLAALGCLAALTDSATEAGLPPPALAFERRSPAVAVITGPYANLEQLLEHLVRDLDDISGRAQRPRDSFIAFAYPDADGKDVRDLKPPPDIFRAAAQTWISTAKSTDRRTTDWAAATLTDVAVDGVGKSAKPFALHFTAGQQRFLTIANELLDGIDPKPKSGSPGRPLDVHDLRATLLGPWPNDRTLKVFNWSPAQERAYALRAQDPSGDKKLGTPGADWLALRGITMLTSAPVGEQIQTSGVHGGWKSGTFSYPIWADPLDADTVRSLLRHPALRAEGQRVSAAARRTLPRGVEIVTCRISRSEQGGYGSFSRPSRG